MILVEKIGRVWDEDGTEWLTRLQTSEWVGKMNTKEMVE